MHVVLNATFMNWNWNSSILCFEEIPISCLCRGLLIASERLN
jgi:hypothetical protein